MVIYTGKFVDTARTAGIFLLNLLIAIIGTAVMEAEIHTVFIPKTKVMFLVKEDLLSAAVAFALGYFVYYRRRWASSKWVWTAGLGWLVLALFFMRDATWATIYRRMSGLGCAIDQVNQSCEDYFVYTILALRSICYSAAAICCLNISRWRQRSAGLPQMR